MLTFSDSSPDVAGPLIYAQINSDSNGELHDYLAEAKAQRKAERDRTIGRAKQKQVAAAPPPHHVPATAPEEAHTRARTHARSQGLGAGDQAV